MPKLALALDGKPIRVYDLDQPVIRIGRGQGMDILVDNVSVSRRQAEIRKDGDRWVVQDLGSSGGTFVNGEKITTDRPLQAGDEISFGKFSLLFDRLEPAAREAAPAAPPRSSPAITAKDLETDPDATRHLIGRPLVLSGDEMEQLQKRTAAPRQAAQVQPSPVPLVEARELGTPRPVGGVPTAPSEPEAGARAALPWRGWLRVAVVVYGVAVLGAWAWTVRETGRNRWVVLEHLSPAYAQAGILPDQRWCVLVAGPDFLALSPPDRERRAEAFFDREIVPLLDGLFYNREPFRAQFVRAAALDLDAMPVKVWRQDSTVYRREQPYRDIAAHAMPQRDNLRQARAVGLLALVWTVGAMAAIVAIAGAVRWARRAF